MPDPLLLPPPQKLTLTGGVCSSVSSIQRIALDSAYPHAEGYTLTISPSAVSVTARTDAGVFYAFATLRQLIKQVGRDLPCVVIEDWPDFPVRGIMLDISRDRVPTMPMLRLWIERLAALKINHLQIYMEHTFAYPSHPDVWRDASPLTAAEIRELDALCRANFIELVPCQNTFGHMERWLKHPRYAGLAITLDHRVSAMGDPRLPSTLNPLDPRSIELIESIFSELAPHFSSKSFNVSADEPFELGKGSTESAVAQRGKGKVYLDYLLALHRLVTSRGHKMLFWGDIIIHYPELIPELPRDLIALDWGYEALHDFDSHAAIYAGAQVPFYLCPGTSSWCALLASTDNMLDNIRKAVRAGRTHGALGILTTDWGDNGHWQPPSSSLPGIAAAAAMCWNAASAALTAQSLAPLLDLHIYEGNVAAHILALGNLYQRVGAPHINANLLAYALQRSFAEFPDFKARFDHWGGTESDISPENLRSVISEIEDLLEKIAAAVVNASDGELLRAEVLHAASMLRHGARRLLLMQNQPDVSRAQLRDEWDVLESAQRRLWLERSRKGGLADSLARFEIARSDYQ